MIAAPAANGGSHESGSLATIPFDRLQGRPLLIMLDVDGTLAPIALLPSLATVPDATRRIVAQLVDEPGIAVVLVSGRAAHDARRVVAVDGVWTIGNHGAEIMSPSGDTIVDPAIVSYAPAVARAASALGPLLQPLPNVVLEDKSWSLAVHYRAADERIVPTVRDLVSRVALENGLRVTDGKKVFEVRPPVRVHKGSAVIQLASQLDALGEQASLLFAGDDATDEDAFRLLRSDYPGAVTIHVGESLDSAAEFRLDGPNEIYELLMAIATDANRRT
jgi:trehalose-phosphatase